MTSPTIRKAVTRMAKTRMDKEYTGEVMKQAQQMSREDYKAVKHMDKMQMIAYLQRKSADERSYYNGKEGIE